MSISTAEYVCQIATVLIVKLPAGRFVVVLEDMRRLKSLQGFDSLGIPITAAAPTQVESQAGEPLLHTGYGIDRIESSDPDFELVVLYRQSSTSRAGVDRNVDATVTIHDPFDEVSVKGRPIWHPTLLYFAGRGTGQDRTDRRRDGGPD